jgi:RNA polymerase sigma factor (sigma-70 family)
MMIRRSAENNMGHGLNAVLDRLREWTVRDDPAPATDAQLMERFLSLRDEDAFATLLHRHGPMVFGVCRRVLNNVADAEDAFQATFLVFVRKMRSIRCREQLGNWLHGVALRTALKVRTSNAHRSLKERQVPARAETSNVHRLDDELGPVLDAELACLPERYRIPVVLCDLEGRSRGEVAHHLGWASGTLSSRLARGRRLLAERLVRRGVALSVGSIAATLARTAHATVPPPLLGATARAAVAFAAGDQLATAIVSTRVTVLIQGVLKAMAVAKLKLSISILVGVVAVGWTLGALALGQSPEPLADPAPQEPAAVPANPAALKALELTTDPDLPKQDAAPKDLKFGKERLDQLIDDLMQKKKTDGEITDALFLATLARLPNKAEIKRVEKLAQQKAKNPRAAWQDLAHALTNSTEFLRHVGEFNRMNPLNAPKGKLLDQFRRLDDLRKADPNAPGKGPFFGPQ